MKELAKNYDPKDMEDRIYQRWMKRKYFHADPKSPKEAFSISLQGAINVNEEDIALKLLENINSLDDLSITCACKLAWYDVCYRMGPIYYKDISGIVPNKN